MSSTYRDDVSLMEEAKLQLLKLRDKYSTWQPCAKDLLDGCPPRQSRPGDSFGVVVEQILFSTWVKVARASTADRWQGLESPLVRVGAEYSYKRMINYELFRKKLVEVGSYKNKVLVVAPVYNYDVVGDMPTGLVYGEIQETDFIHLDMEFMELDVFKAIFHLGRREATMVMWDRKAYEALRSTFGFTPSSFLLLEYVLFPEEMLADKTVSLEQTVDILFGEKQIHDRFDAIQNGQGREVLDRLSVSACFHATFLAIMTGKFCLKFPENDTMNLAFMNSSKIAKEYPDVRSMVEPTGGAEAGLLQLMEGWATVTAMRQTVKLENILTLEGRIVPTMMNFAVTFPEESSDWKKWKTLYLQDVPFVVAKVLQEMIAKKSMKPLWDDLHKRHSANKFLQSLLISGTGARPTSRCDLWGLAALNTEVGNKFFRRGEKFAACSRKATVLKMFSYEVPQSSPITKRGFVELVSRWCSPCGWDIDQERNERVGVIYSNCETHDFPASIQVPGGGEITFKRTVCNQY